MTEFATRETLAQIAIVTNTPHAAVETDRSFELPTGLYLATVALYLGFVGVMAVTFMNPSLVLPTVIFALFITAAFGTPMLWVRMKPEKQQRALTWAAFRSRGIETATGRLGAGAATVQVLILPVLIFLWGVIVAVLAALPH